MRRNKSMLVILTIAVLLRPFIMDTALAQAVRVVAVKEDWWKESASKMVKTQIISRDIKNLAVINAMKNTPRHLFIPEKHIDYAYSDRPLPIGKGQTISQPYIVALMTEQLELTGEEKVLEIGTGSGYQLAILSQLTKKCYSIEIVKELASSSSQLLDRLGYKNVEVKWGDGYLGWPEQAPFDRIIVTAAPPEIPEELVKQLKSGGKMVLPVGEGSQELILITKTESGVKKKSIIPVRFVPMIKPANTSFDKNQK